jgi:hypothetical protein
MAMGWVHGEVVEIPSGRADGRSVLVLDGTHEARNLCAALIDRGWRVFRSPERLLRTEGLDLVVLYGFRHIVPSEVLEASVARVVNLHISYLPFNRGAHPAFWCFFDGTPCGVTVHDVDEGLDTGPILAQEYIEIDAWTLTFDDAYWRLRAAVEKLFLKNLDVIADPATKGRRQLGQGTQHRVADLPPAFTGWSAIIGPEVDRLLQLAHVQAAEDQRLIDEIESVRSANNVNWMDILRLAFESAPDRAREILGRINADDQRISALLSALSGKNDTLPGGQ